MKIENIRIKSLRPLVSPALLLDELPISDKSTELVQNTREGISNILKGQDDRLLVIVGPCSIHDPAAAFDYAKKLKKAAERFSETLLLVMRVYFEKPRTTVGWKGLINDPKLDGSFDINQGLRAAREVLLKINSLGVPTGSEFLDTIIPQYLSDATSWTAIGARTTESQIHRELASGLSMPLGFKNGTMGNVKIAADAVCAAQNPHHFLGVTKQGIAAIISTEGNPDTHIILRGGTTTTNYDQESIQKACDILGAQELPARVMVDCSHGNSNKDHTKQLTVVQSIHDQLSAGSKHIFGVMIESNLAEGKQSLIPGKALTYGQSITDGCISWEDTQNALEKLNQAVEKRRQCRTA